MSRSEMLLRAGFYVGYASRVLHDNSYAGIFVGHAEKLNEASYLAMVADIQARAVAAGALAPDEDPFDEELRR